jgi:hypothetical protein
MSLDYNLHECLGGKTNGELIDTISERLEVSEDRAAELTYNVCVALMVSASKLETAEDIGEVMARLTVLDNAGIVSPKLLDIHRGITTNVIPLSREKWWAMVTDPESGSLDGHMNQIARNTTRELEKEAAAN